MGGTDRHGIGNTVTSGCQSAFTPWGDPLMLVPLGTYVHLEIHQKFICNAETWTGYHKGGTNKHGIGFSITYRC